MFESGLLIHASLISNRVDYFIHFFLVDVQVGLIEQIEVGSAEFILVLLSKIFQILEA